MCEELNEELQRGEKAMKALADHLAAMGADNLEQVVAHNGMLVKITATVVSRLEGA